METDIEMQMLMNEIHKLDDRLDTIESKLTDIRTCVYMLATNNKKTLDEARKLFSKDTYASYPNEADLDAEEAKELEEAKINASPEWRTIFDLQNRLHDAMTELAKANNTKTEVL